VKKHPQLPLCNPLPGEGQASNGLLIQPSQSGLTQADLDHLEAHERSIQERTPPDIYAEWLGLVATMEAVAGTGRQLTVHDTARLLEIIEMYDTPASASDTARLIAEIVWERANGVARTVRLLSDVSFSTEP